MPEAEGLSFHSPQCCPAWMVRVLKDLGDKPTMVPHDEKLERDDGQTFVVKVLRPKIELFDLGRGDRCQPTSELDVRKGQ